MNLMTELEDRIVELEIKAALQDELLDSLNETVARLVREGELQQAQLRVLYQKVTEDGGNDTPNKPGDEVPPHY